jgi:hypothetical protein
MLEASHTGEKQMSIIADPNPIKTFHNHRLSEPCNDKCGIYEVVLGLEVFQPFLRKGQKAIVHTK